MSPNCYSRLFPPSTDSLPHCASPTQLTTLPPAPPTCSCCVPAWKILSSLPSEFLLILYGPAQMSPSPEVFSPPPLAQAQPPPCCLVLGCYYTLYLTELQLFLTLALLLVCELSEELDVLLLPSFTSLFMSSPSLSSCLENPGVAE